MKYGLVTLNVLVIGLVIYFAMTRSTVTGSSTARSATKEASISPLDRLTATDIAANIALMVWAPETEAIISDANIVRAGIDSAVVLNRDNTVLLPQILSGDVKTKEDIVSYTTVAGDTFASLATKFGVTSESIRWSNDLDRLALASGTKLLIPPVNGIVHQVGPGDTAENLAQRYYAKADKILAFNDAEVGGLKIGETIVIPDGEKRVLAFATVNRPTLSHSYTFMTRYTSYNPGVFGVLYDRGWCTDWASYRSAQLGNTISQHGTWGDAVSWDSNARRDGYYVGPMPKVGAVYQLDSGWYGHVGVVEEVSPDGAMIKYSDMNGLAGWGNAAVTKDWVSARGYDFIYR